MTQNIIQNDFGMHPFEMQPMWLHLSQSYEGNVDHVLKAVTQVKPLALREA